MLVLLLFFGSGISALIYEVIWSRYLTLMLGSTVRAQTVVLAVFMGGLAIGNRLFGKKSSSLDAPLTIYGILELLVGLYAFAFPTLYQLGDFTFIKLGSMIATVGPLLLSLKLLLSVLLLLLPTILMGGTLPVLAAWLQKKPGLDSSARVGLFYAVNSLGAVFGAGLAGFFLVRTFGMSSSLQLTALGNLFIGLVAVILSKRERLLATTLPVEPKPALSGPTRSAIGFAPFAWLVALTGGISMGLEVLSSRALALIVGGSLQAFALVLMSFILGIGLGSVVISSSQAARRHGWKTVYGLLLLAGIIVVVNVMFIEQWAIAYTDAKAGLAANYIGYGWHRIAVALLAFSLLGVPAAFLGAVVPLAIRLVSSEEISLGDEVGRLLTWNTCGAVLGVLLTGFLIMPAAGLRGAFATLGILLLVSVAAMAYRRNQTRTYFVGAVLVLAAIVGVSVTGEGWRFVIGAGLFRYRMVVTPEWLRANRQAKFLFYKDGADATVCVQEVNYTNDTTQLALRINGKPDASTRGDLGTQYLLAHLPMMARPDAKQVFVLGFGSGITSGALLGHPIERLTIAENCKPVLEAGPVFGEANRGVLTNARVRVRNDDARAVLKLSPDKYDLIISEPSNPWVAGIGSVFSKEFYELCASRLGESGIMAQWFHRYEMSDRIVFVVLRTFASVFPNMEIWDSQEGDLILLGGTHPWKSDPEQYAKVFARPQPRQDLESLRITSPEALWARQIASQRTAAVIAGDGPLQTDDTPILEYEAPEAFFLGGAALKLYLFDERSMQFPLADPKKITTLRSVPDRQLLELFTAFGSSNPDIRIYMNALANRASGALDRIDPLGEAIFRPPDSYPENPRIPTNATPEFATLLKLEARMLRHEDQWKECAGKMEETLTKMIGENKLHPRDFSPTYYAALAARFAIGHGDYEDALRILRVGFVFSMTDEQLLYLSRVLDRIVPPAMLMEQFRRKPKI